MDRTDGAEERGGECRVMFAFDVAHAIDLGGAAQAVRDPSSPGALGRTHPAPSYFQFTPPPLRVSQRGAPIALGRWRAAESVELVLFDFGAVLVAYSIPISSEPSEWVELSCSLASDTGLAKAARERVEALTEAIAAHLTKAGTSRVVEDYSVLRLPGTLLKADADSYLREHGAALAGALRAERHALSREVLADALSVRLQYGPGDLALVDWHAAIVFDDDPEDVLRVLEYANVQLLEMRFLDSQLDQALEDSLQTLSRRDARRYLGPLALHRDLRSLSSMQLEAAFLFERLGNTLKVSGDQYLARLLRQSGARFRLDEWNSAAQRKLAALDNVYDKLHDHASTLRTEFLEFLIVLLIVVEIVLTLTGH